MVSTAPHCASSISSLPARRESGLAQPTVVAEKAEGNPMNVSRLIYKSIATAEVVSNETLRDLEQKSAAANAAQGISGLLILSGNVFLQVLEGAARDITALFGRIVADKRHRQVELVTFEAIAERSFDDWNMRLVDLYDLSGDKRAYLASKYKVENGSILIPDGLCQICGLLLDARFVCLSAPWNNPGESAVSTEAGGQPA
jgi:hypothetical protein